MRRKKRVQATASDDFQSRLQLLAKTMPAKYRSSVYRDIKALGRAGARSYPSLLGLLENPASRPGLRAAARWMLGRLRDRRALPTLLRVFKKEKGALAFESAASIGMLGNGSTVGPLVSALRNSPEVEKRVAAAYGLRLLADKHALKALLQKLSDKEEHPRVRGEVAEGLACLRDRSAVPALLAALDDPSEEVRFWAAFALGELGDRRALPKLGELAARDRAVLKGWWSVRKEARNAIKEITRETTEGNADLASRKTVRVK